MVKSVLIFYPSAYLKNTITLFHTYGVLRSPMLIRLHSIGSGGSRVMCHAMTKGIGGQPGSSPKLCCLYLKVSAATVTTWIELFRVSSMASWSSKPL